MGLTERKLINNSLPKFKEGLIHMPTQEGWGLAAVGALDFTGSALGAFGNVKSTNDLIGESGTTVGQGSGFSFLKQKDISAGELMSELAQENTTNTLKTAATGASLGSAFGPIGAGIGGVLGGAVGFIGGLTRKKTMADRIRLALLQIDLNNNYNMASAQTNYLTNQYKIDHNYSQNGRIYGAKDGLMPTKMADGSEPNAMVSNGEIIGHVDPFGNVIDAVRVGKGKDNKDTIPVHLAGGKEPSDNSFVITNKYGISDYVANTGDIVGGLAMQKNMKDLLTIKQLVNKLFPAHFAPGKEPSNIEGSTLKPLLPIDYTIDHKELYDNIVPPILTKALTITPKTGGPKLKTNAGSNTTSKGPWSLGIANALSTMYGLVTAYGMRPKGSLSSPDTYVEDRNARQIGQILSGLRANTQPQIEAARGAEARNAYAMRMAGTSSGRYLPSAVASNIGLLRNYATIEAEGNRENNQYLSNWANYWGNSGLQGAQRAQLALMHDYDARNRAHGAMIQLANMSSLNALAQIQQYLKNITHNNQFNRVMSYYDLSYDADRNNLLSLLG